MSCAELVTICDLEPFHHLPDGMKPKKPIESLILTVRGQKIILDADLAEIYGVETRALNQAVKRNHDRFQTISCLN